MRSWWQGVWRFLRELSGEAALERRMSACGCSSAKDAATAALEEQFGGIHRCC